ncbi:alkaline phosphatase family protein [Aneurinibacillus terranovensis]|uniref:alkaline phosphatase family protein n=1 Tax=Aneurinibacillus terranovensis TaxID=278991 RepID=UPI0009D6E7E7|nr:alkaline phosphatase family protein [Aneurinibacillus terranovensis]
MKEHPSQPNYPDLFSGSNQGVTNDALPPHTFSTDNLGSELIKKKLTFGGYSENLPSVGYTGAKYASSLFSWDRGYARKHNPWVNFNNLPAVVNMPLSSFPKDYAALPTVSFVIPNLQHDMHDGSING